MGALRKPGHREMLRDPSSGQMHPSLSLGRALRKPGQGETLRNPSSSQNASLGAFREGEGNQVKEKPCATQVQVKMHPWVRLGRAKENQVKEKPKWAGIAQTRSRRNPDQADRLLPGQLKT